MSSISMQEKNSVDSRTEDALDEWDKWLKSSLRLEVSAKMLFSKVSKSSNESFAVGANGGLDEWTLQVGVAHVQAGVTHS